MISIPVYDSWVNQIKKGMADAIQQMWTDKVNATANIYTERIDKGFERPAFSILQGWSSEDDRLAVSGKQRISVQYSMRVKYFAHGVDGETSHSQYYDEMSAVGEWLTEYLKRIYIPAKDFSDPPIMVHGADTHFNPSDNRDELIFYVTYTLNLERELVEPVLQYLDESAEIKP